MSRLQDITTFTDTEINDLDFFWVNEIETSTATLSIASPCAVSKTAHNLEVGNKISFTTTGALPTGLVASTNYYIISSGFGANSFRLSATFGGTAINTSGTQSGVHTYTAYVSKKMSGEKLKTLVVPSTPASEVSFDKLTPTTAGVVFDPNTPATTNILYYSTIDGSTWIYNGTIYKSKAIPNSTEWYLYGTTIDAGSNKTASIKRSGAIFVSVDSYFSDVRVGRGNGSISSNTIVGDKCLLSNTTGAKITAVGSGALQINTASNNTAIGWSALNSNISGNSNVAIGTSALQSNTASNNTGLGFESGFANTTGSSNSFFGVTSGRFNTTGINLSGIGVASLYNNTTGNDNVGLGLHTLFSNLTGSNNTSAGNFAGRYLNNGSSANTTPENSVFLGYSTRSLTNNDTNQIVIGYLALGKGSNTVQLGNTSITDTYLQGAVTINNAYKLPTVAPTAGQVLSGVSAGVSDWVTLSTAIPQANTIYVDSVNGLNDTTGRGDINTPYLTPEYALSNIVNTGTIIGNTATNYTISGISDVNNANLKIGQNIGGTGIAYDTVIVAKGNQGGNANTITLSKPTTATATAVTITWITSYRLVLNGNFVATGNWFKQGMYIDAQTSTIAWGAFFLFNNTTTQIMPYTLLGNGRYSQTTATTSRFFYFVATQTADFSINLNYETVHTIDTNHIFYISTVDGRCILRGVLAKALFGSVAFINTSKLTVYSSTYGLLGGYSTDNIAYLNLEGGIHQTPLSIYVITGSISFINTNCTLIGSVNGSFWTHIGVLAGTTLTLSGGSITASGSGTIYAGGNGCSINTTCCNLGNFDLIANGATIENNGEIRGATIQAGTLINNGHLTGGFTISGGTFINNGLTEPLGGDWTTLVAGAKIYNYGTMKITLLAQSGGTWENRGTLELYSYSQVTSITGGTFKNYGTVKNISKDTDIFQLSGTGVIENYGTIENTNVNTTSAIIKKSGGTLKLYSGSILKVANGLSPIWCVNNDTASKNYYMFNCITNCNNTTAGLNYAFPSGYVPNDLVGGVSYENVNY